MGWFDRQIRQRMQSDQDLFEESFVRLAGAVLGGKTAKQLQDQFLVAREALEEILKFYHCKAAEILADVNRQLCRNNTEKMFVTVWLGILDLETGVLTASNGGHEEPVLRSGAAFELVHDQHSLVLGGFARTKYTDYEIRMKPGDILFVYTDGVPEANDINHQRYGTQRLLEALNASASSEPEELLAAVKESVSAFTGDAEQFDDLTMLCVRFKKRPGCM